MYTRINLIITFSLINCAVFSQEIKISNTSSATQKKGYYKWTIFVVATAAILNTIEHVEYLLDPTFPNPQVSIYDKDHNFSYSATGWGEFEIKVKIVFKDKQKPFQYYNYWLQLKESSP